MLPALVWKRLHRAQSLRESTLPKLTLKVIKHALYWPNIFTGVDSLQCWDLIIVGAGPAGLTAGIYGARTGIKTLIIEKGVAGGVVAEAPFVENYPGFPEGIKGADLAKKMVEQTRLTGATISEFEEVTELNLEGPDKNVRTSKAFYQTPALIIATGCTHKHLGVPGEEEFLGRGVSYCAVCDGPLFKKKKVLVVGGGNTAVSSSMYLSNIASEVKLAHRRKQLRVGEVASRELADKGVKLLWNTEIKTILGEGVVKSVVLYDNETCETREIEVDGVFIQVGEDPNSQVVRKAGIKVDEQGYIEVDSSQKTNIEGVYACGDVTMCQEKQIGTAVGQGIVAALGAFGYVKNPYYRV